MSMQSGLPVAGWYADPEGGPRLRYWDGARWTEHFADRPTQPAAAQPQAAQEPVAQPAEDSTATAAPAPEGDVTVPALPAEPAVPAVPAVPAGSGGVDPAAPTPSVPRSARARARAEITAEILASARRHLADEGAAGLSLRAVARDLGMVSSAVYRYVPSRDDLLTQLIVAAYDSLGTTAEVAERAVPRPDLPGRFRAICGAVRTWALANPHEYALIYGTPVPGNRAPTDTIPPASRVPNLLLALLADAVAEGRPLPTSPLPARIEQAMAPVRADVPPQIPPDLLRRGLLAWSGLFGAVSFELFGHLHNVIAEEPDLRAAFFDQQVTSLMDLVGLGDGPGTAG